MRTRAILFLIPVLVALAASFLLRAAPTSTITLDTTTTCQITGNVGATTLICTFTVGTHDNRALVFMVAGLLDAGATAATDNDFAMTKVADSGGGWTCQVWKMVNPPIGVNKIRMAVTSGQTFEAIYGSVLSVYGSNQDILTVTPLIDATSTNPSALTTAVTTTAAGDWIAGIAVNHNGTLSTANGQTEISNTHNATFAVSQASGYLTSASVGANTMGWTQAGGTESHGIALVAIRPYRNAIRTSQTPSYFSGPQPLLHPGLTTSTSFAGTGLGWGDTNYCTFTSLLSGFTGVGGIGGLFCNFNDGTTAECTLASICAYRILTYDPSNAGNTTFALASDFSSYGAAGAAGCPGGVNTFKSRKPFAYKDPNGVAWIYNPIVCLNLTFTAAFQSGFIMLPNGVNQCNWSTFQTGGTAGANSCDSGNWKTTGDAPAAAGGFQWPLADGTNKLTSMQIVDFLCLDNVTNCPVAPGVDPAYIYFLFTNSAWTQNYIGRFPKTLTVQQVPNPANWSWCTNPGSDCTVWSANGQSDAVDIALPAGFLAGQSIVYHKELGVFGLWSHNNSTTNTSSILFYTSTKPWGPFTATPYIPAPVALGQFASPIAGLCPKYSGGLVYCTVAQNNSSGHTLQLEEQVLGSVPQIFSGVR